MFLFLQDKPKFWLSLGKETKKKMDKHQKKIPFLVKVLIAILAVVLILLGERIVFDLNRIANPVVQKIEAGGQVDYRVGKFFSPNLSYEKSRLAPQIRIYYPTKEKARYLAYKLLIQASFIIPVFLLMFLFYWWMKLKERKAGWEAVVYAYVIFALWMMLHLLKDTAHYVINQYRSAAVYIILGILIIILTPLVVFFQKKMS